MLSQSLLARTAMLLGTILLLIWLLPASTFLSLWPPRFKVPEQVEQPLLRFNAHNQFHIAIFADLHYGEEENGWGIDQDINSSRVLQKVLAAEVPDFVVLNGDLITGENTLRENSSHYMDVIAKPLVDGNVPWASTYGNHDSQFNLSREALFAEESKYALSYTRHSPDGVPGITNYYLPIYPAEKETSDAAREETPVAILWFFDSQGGGHYQSLTDPSVIPNWVDGPIVTWFLTEQKLIKQRWGKDIPSLAFVHIPPTAFLDVQKANLLNHGDASANFPGLNEDVPLAAEGDGWQDIPFMQALVNTPALHSIYSGHDHGDSWCGNWPPPSASVAEGVSTPHVCFCKHSGYGGYGTWNRGSRVLSLAFGRGGPEEMLVESWVRMESGEVVQRVTLNSTYGIDVYPSADGEEEAAI